MSIAEFLLARIAEDAAAAQAALERGSTVYDWATLRDRKFILADSTHIPRWRPARVLAECEAKRRIVRDYQHEVRDYRAGYTNVQPGHKTMKHLALPYADHPDYRAEWKP